MDALISSITYALTSVQQEYLLVVGVEEEIKKLKRNFITIQNVLEDAERRHIKESGVKEWLAELKQVCYNTEDVLVDWNAQEEVLEQELVKEAEATTQKRNECFCFRNKEVKEPLHNHLVRRIKDICERLDEINSDKSIYKFSAARGGQGHTTTTTSNVVTESLKMKCRDDEKRKIINILLCPIDDAASEETPIVVAIVGGKTTALARLAYNDEEVEHHFQERIWICVSEPFDPINLAKEIIRALDDSSPTSGSRPLSLLLRKISKLVKGKRILLVLDDVWNDNPAAWEPFRLCFMGCGELRILVTTRKHRVAEVMEKTYEIHVGLLSDDDDCCYLHSGRAAMQSCVAGQRRSSWLQRIKLFLRN